jgi:antitoxin CcdA
VTASNPRIPQQQSKFSGMKRPVNITLNENLLATAKKYTHNLSATLEELLTEFVQQEQNAFAQRQKHAHLLSKRWNHFHDTHGSFADEYNNL